MLEPLHDHVFVARFAGSVLLVVVAPVVPPVAPLPFVGLVVVLLVGLNGFEGVRTYLDSRAMVAAL